MIQLSDQSGSAALLQYTGGTPRWHNLRLLIEHASGEMGAQATIKINGADVPDQNGGFAAGVSPGGRKSASVDALLLDGDAVSVEVQVDPVHVTFSATGLEEHY